MKLASIAMAIALAACATTAAPHRAAHTTSTGVDYAKMNAVDARALANGIDVIWIHPPTKPAS